MPAAKKRKRKGNPYAGVSVSQLLAQRETMQQQHQQQQQQQLQLQQHQVQQQLQQQQLQQQQLQQQHAQQQQQLQSQQIQQSQKICQQNVWMNPSQGANINSPHPHQSASPTVPQIRLNGPTENYLNRSMLMNSNSPVTMINHGHQQVIKADGVMHSVQSTEFQINNKQNLGSQVLTVNGANVISNLPQSSPDPNQRVIQQHITNPNLSHQQPNGVSHPTFVPNQNNVNFTGLNHVIGPNGQIIEIQTSNISRSQSLGNIYSNDKINMSIDAVGNKSDQVIVSNQNTEQINVQNSMQITQNESVNSSSQPPNINRKNSSNTNSINIISDTNIQHLTPEVIQRINQQQQIFIQQNQKQMELAMKGIKTHVISNTPRLITTNKLSSSNDSQEGNSTLIDNQMMLSNNMMGTTQTRVPPWQLNRLNKLQQQQQQQQNNQNQIVQFVNKQNQPTRQNQIEITPNMPFQGTQNVMHLENVPNVIGQVVGGQNIYSRVPPLHHHTPPPWPEEVQKKKSKPNKNTKKVRAHENQRTNCGMQGMSSPNTFGNGDNRNASHNFRTNHVQNNCGSPMNPSPSFMEDPSGYLAQQTALLNSTISRQVGLHPMNPQSPGQTNTYSKQSSQHINAKDDNNFNANMKSFNSRNLQNTSSTNFDQENHGQNSSNGSFNNSPTQSNIPDSSINCDKSSDSSTMQQSHSHCQGCIAEMNESNNELATRNLNAADCEIRLRNANFQSKMQNYMDSLSSMKSESCSQPGTPSPNQSSDENPVTSSTFGERQGSRPNSHRSDSRGPIQGGIISTSNGSPMETYQLPELSPTPSNSSRNTDTPQSKNSGSGYNISSSCPFTNPSPSYSNQGSSRESINSNPATPSPGNINQNFVSYSSPDPMTSIGSNPSIIISSSQNNTNEHVNPQSYRMNCFNDPNSPIANENILMNIDAANNTNQRIVQNINGSTYYVPTHLGAGSSNMNNGNMIYIPSNGVVTTMASGHTLSRNTITSVLAGKAQTATTSMSASAGSMPHIYPANTSSNTSSNTCSTQQPNAQLSHIHALPNYPLHVAGTVAQSLVSKSPLEMVQSVVSSIQVSQSQNNSSVSMVSRTAQFQGKNINGNGMNSNQIVMPSNGQFMITGMGQGTVMAPPPPKGHPLPPISVSPHVTSVTASMSQAIPAVGGVPQVLNHSTVLVNTLQQPFMLQPQMVTVDGQVVNQNVQMPHIVTGNLISQGQTIDTNNPQNHNLVQKSALLSPDLGKKKGKKRKAPSQAPTSVMQITTHHSPNNVLLQHSSQQQPQPQQFPSQGFQMSPNGNISTAPMLQALTIVPGKAGVPAHIVMNGQAAGNFGSQQIITNSQGAQHINLLQPVNLLNGTTGVVQNFPTFQQFIVPGLGGMVMTADGTAILQDASNMPMQLQIQNVNGQNVLTPVQNQGILTAGPTGMVIRTQNSNNKMMQSQHSPGAQFLSPNGGQIVMGGSPFNGQLSPLVASVSPNQTVTFNGSPPQVRSNIQQEYLQCNQMGQTLMLPLSPNQITVSSSANQQNTTFVQQNTTIVQQQTTMVSNNSNQFQNNAVNHHNAASVNLEQSVVMNQNIKQNPTKGRPQNILQIQNHPQQMTIQNANDGPSLKRIALQYPQMINQIPQINGNIKNDAQLQQILANINQNNILQQQQNLLHPHVRHSVSTQTLINQQQNGNKSPVGGYSHHSSNGSPPDTTTHSPLGSLDGSNGSPTNSISSQSPNSSHGNLVDTTGSPEPVEQGSLAMVHCISSSEPDSLENNQWGRKTLDKKDIPGNTIHLSETPPNNQNTFYSVDSSGIHFSNQTITVSSLNNRQNLTITPVNYYPKNNMSKHGGHQNTITLIPANAQAISNEKLSKTGSMTNIVEIDTRHINNGQISSTFNQHDKIPNMGRNMNAMEIQRNCNNPDNNSGNTLKRISVSSANEGSSEATSPKDSDTSGEIQARHFKEGDLVWGPAKGYPAWPGKLVTKNRVNGKEDGKVLVRWFGGDKCLTVVDSAKLQTLSEGLEAHHAARTKCRKSRKLNGQLEKAIQEAMAELDRLTESREKRKGVGRFENASIHKMDLEMSDINGNSSKPFLKSTVAKNNTSKVSTDISNKNKRENQSKTARSCSSVVKIAPHPVASNAAAASEVAGRLRSSQR